MKTSVKSSGCLLYTIKIVTLGDNENWSNGVAWGISLKDCTIPFNIWLVPLPNLLSGAWGHWLKHHEADCTHCPNITHLLWAVLFCTAAGLDHATYLSQWKSSKLDTSRDIHVLVSLLLLHLYLTITLGLPAEGEDTWSRHMSLVALAEVSDMWKRPNMINKDF